jgi:Ca2+-binding EF-hand superfamily protein
VSTDDAFARRLFKAIDTDDDGLIDIDEFRLAHKTATETRESVKTFFSPERQALEPQEIDALFAKIDLDRDGCITKRELTHYLRDTLRCPDPDDHAERLRSFIDRDDDKLIDKEEFLSAYRGLDIAP